MEAKLKGKWPNFEKSSYWNSIKSTIFLEKHNLIGSKTARSGTLEGFLFPETYQYEKETSIESLIDSALSQFKERALPILKEHPWASTHEGLYKLVTLASIVEKESGHADEQPMIASVFWNRIEKKMRLQSDPTTIYALFPNFDGNLRRVHLNEKTDYNTYQIPSLPLGPIANPGLSAIQAVLNPESSDYLYFVSKGDGYHIFSKDYETHRQRVVQYQIKGRKKRSAASEEQRK